MWPHGTEESPILTLNIAFYHKWIFTHIPLVERNNGLHSILFQLAWNCCRYQKCHDFVCRWSLHESFWYGYCSGTVLLSGRLYCAQVLSHITVFSTKFLPSTWQDSDVFHTQLSGTAFLVCVCCLSIHQEDTFFLSQQSHEWLFQYIHYIFQSGHNTVLNMMVYVSDSNSQSFQYEHCYKHPISWYCYPSLSTATDAFQHCQLPQQWEILTSSYHIVCLSNNWKSECSN